LLGSPTTSSVKRSNGNFKKGPSPELTNAANVAVNLAVNLAVNVAVNAAGHVAAKSSARDDNPSPGTSPDDQFYFLQWRGVAGTLTIPAATRCRRRAVEQEPDRAREVVGPKGHGDLLDQREVARLASGQSIGPEPANCGAS
jgi:hypothetical protein